MEKTQSLLAALFGWIIGSLTMWRLGFDTPTALIGGLLVGAPLAYIAYDPKAFGITLKQQSVLAATRYTYVPHVEFPSFNRALQLVSATIGIGLVVCLWMIQAYTVVFCLAGGTGDDGKGDFYEGFLGAFAWTFIVTFLCVGMIKDGNAPWGRWFAKRETTKNTLIWIATLLGPLNMVILLTFVGLIVLAIVTLVVRDVTIRVCSSGRLIAMASAVSGLVLEWSTGSIAMGMGGLFVSFALQWLALHKWAIGQIERGNLLTW